MVKVYVTWGVESRLEKKLQKLSSMGFYTTGGVKKVLRRSFYVYIYQQTRSN